MNANVNLEAALVFDLPAEVKNPTLLINEEWLTKFRLDALAADSSAAQLSNP